MRIGSALLFAAIKRRNYGSTTEKMVMIALADLSNERGQCWPGHEYLADICECSVRTIQRMLQSLESKGQVRIQRRTQGGKKIPNLYTITDKTLWPVDPTSEAGGGDTRVKAGPDCMAGNTPTISIHPMKQRKTKPRSTRDISLEEQLADTSWADSVVLKKS